MNYLFQFLSKLNIGLVVLSLTVLFFHFFIGKYLKAYKNSFYFDRFLHFFGSLVFSLFAYTLIYNLYPFAFPKFYLIIFVFTLGLTLGTLFELAEFTRDYIFGTNDQVGLKDTMIDLVFDALGAIISSIIAANIL